MKCLPLQFSKIMQFPLNPLQEHLLGNVIRQLIAWQLPPWNDVSAFYTNKDSCMRPCMYIARFHFNVGIHFQPVHLNRNSSYFCHIKQCSHIGIFSHLFLVSHYCLCLVHYLSRFCMNERNPAGLKSI